MAEAEEQVGIRQIGQNHVGVAHCFRIESRFAPCLSAAFDLAAGQVDEILCLTIVPIRLPDEIPLRELQQCTDVLADIPGQPEQEQVNRIGNNADQLPKALLIDETHLAFFRIRIELHDLASERVLAGQTKRLASEDFVVVAAAVAAKAGRSGS